MKRILPFASVRTLICFLTFVLVPAALYAQSGWPTFVPPVPDACSRFPAGSVVRNPPALFSRGGSLTVNFSYQTRTDQTDGLCLLL